MEPVALFLVTIASLVLLGCLGEVIFRRTNIPDVIWLIAAGILLGPLTGVVPRDRVEGIAPYFAALTLVVVLFEGGSRLKLDDLRLAAPRSGALAASTWFITMLAIAIFSMLAKVVGLLPPDWTWAHGFLLGAILGGSSSVIIMPAMVQAKVEPRVANLVSLESAITDAMSIVGTTAIIDIMLRGTTGAAGPVLALVKSFGIGLALGAVAGLLWMFALKFLRSSEHDYPITLAALLILYVVINSTGGSAAFGILTFAVLLGNAPAISRAIGLAETVELSLGIRGFHTQVTFMIKTFFFTFIGLMLAPPWSLLFLGVLIGGVIFFSRIPGVRLALIGSDLDAGARKLVTVASPRGMAAGIMATLPFTAGVPGTEGLSTAAFATILTSIIIFAVGFPLARKEMLRLSRPAAPLPEGVLVPQMAAPVAPLVQVVPTEEATGPQPALAAAVIVPDDEPATGTASRSRGAPAARGAGRRSGRTAPR